MTVPPSTSPAVKKWLAATLAATLTSEPGKMLVVSYGDPDSRADDFVVIGDTTSRRVEPHALVGSRGAAALRETYTVPVIVKVTRTTTAYAAEQRAFAVLAVIETVVREPLIALIAAANGGDPTALATLGGNVYDALPEAHTVETDIADGDSSYSWIASCVYPITVQAVL